MKICSNVPGHMAKMASRLIYGKNLEKQIFFGANDLETWYTALGAQVLSNFFK